MTALLLALAAAVPVTAQGRDFAGRAYSILPPGESGDVPPGENSTDQLHMYDALTPLFGDVRSRHLEQFFKPNVFGTRGQGPTHVEETPRGERVRIVRDRYGVAHIRAGERDDLVYGTGWVSGEDRSLIMEILRGPARLAALDAPGALSSISQIVTSGQSFVPGPETEAFVARQTQVLREMGPRGERILRDIDQYVEGINANYRAKGRPHAPWTRNDVYAMVALLAGVFGQGGGDEARRSELLDALRDRLGAERGWEVWDDLRQQFDDETDVTVRGRFPYGRKLRQGGPGNAVIDAGSLDRTGLGLPPPAGEALEEVLGGLDASNALLVSARRSKSGHPLFVAGPQVGYFYPQILMEMDLHGGGIDARGVGVPGFALALVIGRGKDFVWSLTSASNDITDEYVEELCGNDFTYRYKGECRPMGVFDAGTIESPTSPTEARVTFRSTVHGPVVGYATVDGRRVAISRKRSTRGREIASALPIEDMMTNRVRSAADFRRSFARGFEVTFNVFYADDRNAATVSTGLLPRRHPGVDTGLPTIGDGRFEWQGFIGPGAHPQQTRRKGVILNWNNKPARGWTAADDVWHYGSVVRNELFRAPVRARRRHTLASLTGAMNMAATQDLRNDQVLPSIDAVLSTGPAPSDRTARMLELLRDWRANGSSRLDRDLDGKIDHPGAAIMDAAWERFANAVLEPVLGPQLDHLARLETRDNAASSQGSAYNAGWYSYVDKDLRRLIERTRGARRAQVQDPFAVQYCGSGDLSACRSSLWAALEAAGEELEDDQGTSDPGAWRANAQEERIRFLPGFLPETMRWTNRPTFQQVIKFSRHRPREAQRRRPARREPRLTG